MNVPPTNREHAGRDDNRDSRCNVNREASRDATRDELGSLLEAVCEERLTATEHTRLEQLLLASADARAYYLNYIDLHGALYWDLAVAEQVEDDAVAALVDATILRLARPDANSAFSSAMSHTIPLTLASAGPSTAWAPGTVAAEQNTAGQTSRASRIGTSRNLFRRVGVVAAGCLILGLGVWIGNRTAKPGQVAGVTKKHGSVIEQREPAANGHSPAPAVVAKSAVAQHKFGSDDVQLQADPKAPTVVAELPAAAAEIAAADSKVAATAGAANPERGNGAENSVSPNATVKDLRLANAAGSAAASSGTVIAYINDQLKLSWSTAAMSPSAKADDAEWLRRLNLDLLGHIPSTGEFEKFVSNRSPAKRAAEIDRLLDSPAFARNFAAIWTNLLVGRVPRDEVNRPALATFLRQKFGYNRPWQEIVFDLVAAEGRTDQNGAANFLVAHLNGGAIPATGITSRLFLGAQLQCAQCHNHPFSNSKQEQFWAFNSFFQQAVVVRVPKYDAKTGRMSVAGIELATKDINEPRYYETRNGLMKVAYPAFGSTKIDTTQVTNRRRELARLMTSSEDSSLAPAFVNRMWAHFHGRSFTPVVDDMGSHVAPSHPQLLDRLSEEFVRSGYDIKQLIRWICNSEGYQLTSRFGENNSKDDPETGEPPLFTHMYVKPMSPEQLYDSLVVATQGQLAGGPTLDQSDKTRDAWLRQFVVSFETEENDETSTLNGSITQSLLMMNGDLVQGATEVQAGTWLHKLLVSKTTETERIQALFASALSRPATAKELSMVKKLLKSGTVHGKNASIEHAYQDIYWALLNSNEFILNH
jgi:hypothetical protein